ncbi:hypothetical protein BDW74DRAFT_8105 [Aspergillus multicolor]|uniref:uncharacterized protein n=1 Tax=Aspergillus multicolor TaxID=41759 RepID=UPI003CCD297D
MSSTTPRRVGESSWSAEEKQRLHALRTTGSTKDMPWTAFHKLNHFPNHTDAAVQMQWYRMTSQAISARKRRNRGSIGDTAPVKRPAPDAKGSGPAAQHQSPRVLHDTDSESSDGGGDIYDSAQTPNISGDAKTLSRGGGHTLNPVISRPTDLSQSQAASTQTLSSHSHPSTIITPTQSTPAPAAAPAPAPKEINPAPRSSFTPVNRASNLQNAQGRQSAPSKVAPPTQSPPANFESSRTTSNRSPPGERLPQPSLLTDPQQPRASGPDPGEKRHSTPLILQGQGGIEDLETRRQRDEMEKCRDRLIGQVGNEIHRYFGVLQNSATTLTSKLISEHDELRAKLAAETKEKEEYIKEIERLKAEIKRMQEEHVKTEEDKKRITGVCKTLEELVGFIKH